MADIRSLKPDKFILALAEALKEIPEFEKPEWIEFVKTSPHKTRPTLDPNFWHNRAASILRQAYIRNLVGVNRLRTRYGGRKKKGMKPEKFNRAGGKIIRKILQQAEAAGLLEKIAKPKAGRKLTEKGKQFLESISLKEVSK